MRALLIHPPNNFIRQGYGVKRKVSFGHAPPLGIGYIAAYLERDGHEVQILDACAMELNIEQTVERVQQYRPDLVGITVLTNYADRAKELSESIKKRMPHVTTLLGGPHATYFYREILKEMPDIDHVLYGEADAVIDTYARYFKNKDRLKDIGGLVYRDESGVIVINGPPPLLHNLDDIPMPAWHLYDMRLYRPLPLQYRKMPFFTMITSRGCHWQKCKFCFQAGYQAVKYRRHSPERVVQEVEILYNRYGIREIAFWDDTFVMNSLWLKKFASMIREKNLDISWVASGRANTMNEDMIRTVHEAGCWSIFIGVESGNQDLLDLIDKGITLEEIRKTFAATKKVGIETRAAYMLGLPNETPEKGRKTIQLALELDSTYAVFYAAHPRFGTKLYDIALSTGRFLERAYKGMSKVTYVPEGYASAEELAKLIRSAYRRFYLRPFYIFKRLYRLRSYREFAELAKAFILFLGLSNTVQKNPV